jgi:polygalacturonase
MTPFRREFMKWAASGIAATAANGLFLPAALAKQTHPLLHPGNGRGIFDVRAYGAVGDGKQLDTNAINRAIAAAAAAGGGTVWVPSGNYLCYSLHLASFVVLYLDQGATIIAAPNPTDPNATIGYDPPEPQGAWEPYQDLGHNHWHNSLMWGENIRDFAITGPGRIWGAGLSRGHPKEFDMSAYTSSKGVGNKAIALKNCHNVILRDFSILQGGWFGILATGVDNFTIDNLKIDTNRDGIDIDCCKNVRVSNCSVNSPWDDGICPKSSFALGYARPTENVTITNCYVTGDYEMGSLLDGSFRRFAPDFKVPRTGRIKCGTESNGGFKNITISNCVFESCNGLALETEDGAILEDITITNITMRNLVPGPALFLRLGARMRGPEGTPVGTLKRVLISNITSHGAMAQLPVILSGIPGHCIEDVQINDAYFHQVGGGSTQMAGILPPEAERNYPDPHMFGQLPASGIFMRHVKNIELSNVEIAVDNDDQRPEFWLDDVEGSDFFRIKSNAGKTAPRFHLNNVRDFRVSGSHGIADQTIAQTDSKDINAK